MTAEKVLERLAASPVDGRDTSSHYSDFHLLPQEPKEYLIERHGTIDLDTLLQPIRLIH